MTVHLHEEDLPEGEHQPLRGWIDTDVGWVHQDMHGLEMDRQRVRRIREAGEFERILLINGLK